MPSVSFGEDFPLLERMNRGVVAFMESMQANDVVAVAQEIDLVFERCLARPYDSLSFSQQHVVEAMLENVDELLTGLGLIGMNNEIERIGTEGKALKLFFRKTLMTKKNFKNLFLMSDPAVSGLMSPVRTKSIWFLRLLTGCGVYHLWSIQQSADGSSFALALIEAMSKSLHDETSNERRAIITKSSFGLWWIGSFMWAMTSSAIDLAKDCPLEILDRVSRYNWTTILQPAIFHNAHNGNLMRTMVDVGYEDMLLWSRLYWVSYLAYQMGKDQNNDDAVRKAKLFIKKLGKCKQLFIFALEHVIAGGLMQPETVSGGKAALCFLEGTMHTNKQQSVIFEFLFLFFACLVPLPVDVETDALVRRTYSTLMTLLNSKRPKEQAVAQKYSGEINMLCFERLEESKWNEMRGDTCGENLMARFEHIGQAFPPAGETSFREWHQNSLRNIHGERYEWEYGRNEMCANCFKIERELGGGERLNVCKRCSLVCYCSKDCQVNHWKTHKKRCAKQCTFNKKG